LISFLEIQNRIFIGQKSIIKTEINDSNLLSSTNIEYFFLLDLKRERKKDLKKKKIEIFESFNNKRDKLFDDKIWKSLQQ